MFLAGPAIRDGGMVQESLQMKKVQLITDGACLGNPGRGGWAAILLHGEIEKNSSDAKRTRRTIAWSSWARFKACARCGNAAMWK